jgi:hypothetical protein
MWASSATVGDLSLNGGIFNLFVSLKSEQYFVNNAAVYHWILYFPFSRAAF